jgi:hypothetical protein
MESFSDWSVDGILMHCAGEGPTGFPVVDVWESQEAAEAFGARLAPALAEVGIPTSRTCTRRTRSWRAREPTSTPLKC